jgi:hypothetical protein
MSSMMTCFSANTYILPFIIGMFLVVFQASAMAAVISSANTVMVTGTSDCFNIFCFSLAILIA